MINSPLRIYLPLLQGTRDYHAPDLVVTSLTVSSNNVRLVIRNQGDEAVSNGFWVDGYINPSPAPRSVNQVWGDLGSEGLVWSVGSNGLPLQPGDELVLTVGDQYYWASLSQVSWPLASNTAVYVQVDSYNSQTTYGMVLEGHEIAGEDYNNIAGPALVP